MGTVYTKPAVTPAWGETNTTGADMIQPADGAIETGWPLSATPPSRQVFNWILHFSAAAVRYFMQRGLPDWDTAETYQIGGTVIGDDGNVYRSLINGNVNHQPSTSPGQWAEFGATTADITAAIAAAITAATAAITAAYTAAIAAALGTITVQAAFVDHSGGDRVLGTVYQNTTGGAVEVVVDALGGGTPGTLTFYCGPANPPVNTMFQSCPTAGHATLTKILPNNWYYKATVDTLSLEKWTETALSA